MINYAKKILKARSKKGFSQLDLELVAGFSPGTMSRIENGKVNPSKETLFRIAYALQLSWEETCELFGIKDFIENSWTIPQHMLI
jgi:transcriptional regulator with XRE-family HTH domain